MLKKSHRSFPKPRNVTVPSSTFVGWNTYLGVPDEPTMLKWPKEAASYNNRKVVIGKKVLLGCNVIVYEGVRIGDQAVIEDGANIGPDSVIGKRTRIAYGAIVGDEVRVGKDCVIAGFVCDGATIDDGVRIFGSLIHEQTRPHLPWWKVDESPPTILRHSVVAWGAVVIGKVTVGPYSYVLPGAVVRKSIPPKTIVTRRGDVIPAAHWTGSRLRKLIAWWDGQA